MMEKFSTGIYANGGKSDMTDIVNDFKQSDYAPGNVLSGWYAAAAPGSVYANSISNSCY